MCIHHVLNQKITYELSLKILFKQPISIFNSLKQSPQNGFLISYIHSLDLAAARLYTFSYSRGGSRASFVCFAAGQTHPQGEFHSPLGLIETSVGRRQERGNTKE